MFELYPDKLHVGRRTLKTGLAAGLCVLLFYLLGRESPALACLAAVFSLRADLNASLYFGVRRVLGNLLGGVMAVLLIAVKQVTGPHLLVDFLGIFLSVILFITLCNVLGIAEGIVGGMAAFFIIYFNVTPTDSVVYALDRVLDTLIGALVATAVNLVFPPKSIE